LRGISLAELSRIHPAAATAGANPASIRISVPVQEQRRVIEGIWQAGGEIISLAPLRRRLEDLFLEWSGAGVKQEENGHP
jgi:ABC-2 type transport system ATP-binding protein